MKKKLFIVLLLIVMLIPLSVASAKEKSLRFETKYDFVFDGVTCNISGRCLIWAGDVLEWGTENDVGDIEWWMYPGAPPPPPAVSFWDDARVVIKLDGGEITLSEWGSTTWLPGSERANWRGNGRVISATGEFVNLGGTSHETGFVDLTTVPWSGTSKLHINK